MRVLLLGSYELGRPSFGLSSAAAWLERAGIEAECGDLAVQSLSELPVADADAIAFYVPMHTATRVALEVMPRVRAQNAAARILCFGLYAPLNRAVLKERGAHVIIGPEFESSLVDALRGSPPLPGDDERRGDELPKLHHIVPDRRGMPPLSKYAKVLMPDGSERMTGATEASRGCLHSCRHCPLVPIYGGRLRVVAADVVLADIHRQVAAGAEHITFADPDFLCAPSHALRIVREVHARHPELSWDATIKVEHLLRHEALLPDLAAAGCLFLTCAVESFDDDTLALLDKGHEADDLERALGLARRHGLVLSPTFLPFAPWTTLSRYRHMLSELARLDLVEQTAPVQLSIRLLLPAGSLLLDRPEVAPHVDSFAPERLAWQWTHEDPRVDELQARVQDLVAAEGERRTRREIFARVWDLASSLDDEGWGPAPIPPSDEGAPARCTVPFLNEPWYC
jgi:radical SAM superfamily enzyme YgiQ (UPF0313 family)